MTCHFCGKPLDPDKVNFADTPSDVAGQNYSHSSCYVANYLGCSLEELDEVKEKLNLPKH